mmetsp:Transcript_79529/g.200011  ORF Transcript_79529/g.200011 Transcript_79529/m.200011 type:complete len:728 (-) Transcript_79529:187-2370(-)
MERSPPEDVHTAEKGVCKECPRDVFVRCRQLLFLQLVLGSTVVFVDLAASSLSTIGLAHLLDMAAPFAGLVGLVRQESAVTGRQSLLRLAMLACYLLAAALWNLGSALLTHPLAGGLDEVSSLPRLLLSVLQWHNLVRLWAFAGHSVTPRSFYVNVVLSCEEDVGSLAEDTASGGLLHGTLVANKAGGEADISPKTLLICCIQELLGLAGLVSVSASQDFECPAIAVVRLSIEQADLETFLSARRRMGFAASRLWALLEWCIAGNGVASSEPPCLLRKGSAGAEAAAALEGVLQSGLRERLKLPVEVGVRPAEEEAQVFFDMWSVVREQEALREKHAAAAVSDTDQWYLGDGNSVSRQSSATMRSVHTPATAGGSTTPLPPAVTAIPMTPGATARVLAPEVVAPWKAKHVSGNGGCSKVSVRCSGDDMVSDRIAVQVADSDQLAGVKRLWSQERCAGHGEIVLAEDGGSIDDIAGSVRPPFSSHATTEVPDCAAASALSTPRVPPWLVQSQQGHWQVSTSVAGDTQAGPGKGATWQGFPGSSYSATTTPMATIARSWQPPAQRSLEAAKAVPMSSALAHAGGCRSSGGSVSFPQARALAMQPLQETVAAWVSPPASTRSSLQSAPEASGPVVMQSSFLGASSHHCASAPELGLSAAGSRSNSSTLGGGASCCSQPRIVVTQPLPMPPPARVVAAASPANCWRPSHRGLAEPLLPPAPAGSVAASVSS